MARAVTSGSSRTPVPDVAGADGAPGDGETLADFAYGRLRERVVTCDIRPGTAFSESEMAADLRLSKTPIREALLRLRLDGLIRVHSRTGWSVSPVTLKDAKDICALRALLDGEAAFRAAEHPARAAQYLADRERALASSATGGGAGRFIEADAEFHLEVARAALNERLLAALANTLMHFRRLCYLSNAVDEDAPFHRHAHDDLIGAIGAGNGERARELAVQEVRQVMYRLIETFISSHSVSSANVSAVTPAQHFYLDITKDPGPNSPSGGTSL